MKILFGISHDRFLHTVVPKEISDVCEMYMQEGRAKGPLSSEKMFLSLNVCGSAERRRRSEEEATGRGTTRNHVSSLEPSAQDVFSAVKAAGDRKGRG